MKKKKAKTYGTGGRYALTRLWKENEALARARILEVLEQTGGCVSQAWRRFDYCCRTHFDRFLRKRGFVPALEEIRERCAATFALPGMPVRRGKWRIGFRARKDAGKPYKPNDLRRERRREAEAAKKTRNAMALAQSHQWTQKNHDLVAQIYALGIMASRSGAPRSHESGTISAEGFVCDALCRAERSHSDQ